MKALLCPVPFGRLAWLGSLVALLIIVLQAELSAQVKPAGAPELLPAPAGIGGSGGDPLARLMGGVDGVQSITQSKADIRIRELRGGRPAGDLPPDVARQVLDSRAVIANGREQRGWTRVCYHWAASGLLSQPLYFEDWNLERYGYSPKGLRLVQPALSAGRFYLTVITLPYQMVVHPPREKVYALGYYRPGSPAPYRWSRPEFRITAGAVATGAWMGLILLIQ